MGTRSITIVKDEDNKTILTMYRQYDGNISHHGHDLGSFLKNKIVINGFNNPQSKTEFNGMGCLAAQLVANFKTGIGKFYLIPSNYKDCGEEYIYTITYKNNQINIKCFDVWRKKIIFSGSPEEIIEQNN